jgi:hypothetical protein
MSDLPIPAGTYPNVAGASFIRPYPANVGTFVGRNRRILRKVWNGKETSVAPSRAMGNFRLAYNAGDPLSRVNFSSGGPNMITTTGRPKLYLANNRDGGQRGNPSDPDAASTNVKYVYDSSLFTRFLREQSINYGYAGLGVNLNADYSAGGANNGANVAFRMVRIH